MERLRDGQMTMAGRPGPESRLRETYTLLRVGSGCYAKCTELRPSQQIWQGDPLHRHPPPPPLSHPSPSPSFPSHPFLLFLPSLTPNQEVMSWHRECRQVWECYLHHYHFVSSFFLWQSNYVCSFLGNSTTSSHSGWTSAKLLCVTVQFINEDHIQIYVRHCQNK